MNHIGIRRYYLDNLILEAKILVEVKDKISENQYFVELFCSEKDVDDIRKDELFRFFDKEPKPNSVYLVIKNMVVDWVLEQINKFTISEIRVPIYKRANEEKYEDVNINTNNLEWGNIDDINIVQLSYDVADILLEGVGPSPGDNYCITGDMHGDLNFNVFYQAIKEGYKNIFVCGDFGYIWNGSLRENDILDYLSEIGLNIYFVCGNHENFDLLYKYPVVEINGGKAHKIRENIYHLMRGEVFTFGNKKIFAFGGASSIDKHLRKEGISWWNQEIPNKEEKNNAVTNLFNHNNKVDYIITHTGYSKILGEIYSKYTADEVSDFLDEIYNNIDFDWWYHGHMHVNHVYEEGRTTCINNSILKIDI